MSGALRIIGCMSGTSCDGVDSVLVEVDRSVRSASVVRGASVPLGEAGDRLLAFSRGEAASAGEICLWRDALSEAYVDAARAVLGGGACDLVVAHGQTVFHGRCAGRVRTWQLFEPALVARAVRAPVLSDLRAADVAAGGEGAPITPAADAVLFGAHAPCAIVNLGGFCNATLLEGDGVRGFDVCPCNQVLDEAARRWLGEAFDRDGASALAGRVHGAHAERLSDAWSSVRERSLGTGDEALEVLATLEELDVPDRLATLCDGVARCVRDRVGSLAVFVAGGGARNRALVDAIARRCEGVRSTGEVGIEPELREGACLAVLGGLALRGEGLTLPGVTGCASPAPVSGSWTLPPAGGWRVTRGEDGDG